MVLSRPIVVLLGIATVVPWVYMPLFIAFVFLPITRANPTEAIAIFDRIFAIHMGVGFFCMALMAFFVVYLFKTSLVPNEKKALWAVVLFAANLFAMPIFWYIYMWKPSRLPRARSAL